jgi:small subunit ribosomal protein S20
VVAESRSVARQTRKSAERRQRNRQTRTHVKTSERVFEAALASREPGQVAQALSRVASVIDKAAATKALHKNAARRKKSRLAQRANKLEAK